MLPKLDILLWPPGTILVVFCKAFPLERNGRLTEMLLSYNWKLGLGKKIKVLDLHLVDRPEVSKLQIVGQLFL